MTLLFDVKKNDWNWLSLFWLNFQSYFTANVSVIFHQFANFFMTLPFDVRNDLLTSTSIFSHFLRQIEVSFVYSRFFLWHFKFDVKNYIKYTVVVLIEFSVIFTSNESVIFYVKSKCHFSIRQFFYDNSIRQKKIKNDWKCNVIVLVEFSFTFYVKSKCHKKSSNSSVKFSFPAENSYVKCVNSADAKPVDNKKVQKGTPSSIKGKGESTGTEEKHAIR